MQGGLILGGMLFDQPREAPTTSCNAALRSRNWFADLVILQAAVEHECFLVPLRLRLWVEPGPFVEPLQVDELRGDEDRRRRLVHTVANARTAHMKATCGERVRNTGDKLCTWSSSWV